MRVSGKLFALLGIVTGIVLGSQIWSGIIPTFGAYCSMLFHFARSTGVCIFLQTTENEELTKICDNLIQLKGNSS